jgi:dGTPase
MLMDPEYKKLVLRLEKHYPPYAKKSTECLGRRKYLEEDPFRTPFERDCHRVLHSLPFRRLKHKTQVFFAPKDDHICTRLEHSLHVASISSTICKRLHLNYVLAEAIALAHDLGHPPFGHLGENAMNRVHQEYNMTCKGKKLPDFMHEAQSLRVVDIFRNSLHDRLNLTLEVRDGVVCHWGEPNEKVLRPDYGKNLRLVDTDAARRDKPATLEGCVVRMADTISYLGRDFEDACMARLVSDDDIPPDIKGVLGDTNSRIIGTLVNDLVGSSKRKDYLQFSDRVYTALVKMKKSLNEKKIYGSKALRGQEDRIFGILSELFRYFLRLPIRQALIDSAPNDKNYYVKVYYEFLDDMNYPVTTSKGQIVSDFVAGMTDNFAMDCFEDLFEIQRVI